MADVIIPETSLCAIVRDEVINPAGGIIKFVDAHMPHVESGVIVDTGSEDGTRELLEDLKAKYTNLEIFDRKFDGYAPSRNFSLKKLRTKRALVLDADERLTKDDFSKLHKFIGENPAKGYYFGFLNVYPDETQIGNGHNPRLFELVHSMKYKQKWEWLCVGKYFADDLNDFNKNTGIQIKHFVPYPEARKKKKNEWYSKVQKESLMPELSKKLFSNKKTVGAPSKCPSFSKWKEYNPHEKEYV